MGGIVSSNASSQDKYVLRVEESKAVSGAVVGIGSSTKPSGKIHPVPLAATTPQNSTATLPMGSSVKQHPTTPLKQQSSVSTLVKQQSSVSPMVKAPSTVGSMVKSPSMKNSQILIVQPSSRGLNTTSSNATAASKSMKCSETAPWLLKQAKLQGCSLGDFEYGRVIGK